MTPHRPLLLAALLCLSAACAARTALDTGPADTAAVAALRADLAATFGAPVFHRTIWGVVVESLDTGETLFARNPGALLMPASNMKILTLAASVDRLGWDFTFETRLETTAPVENGVLKGDLVVVGGGDPSIGGRIGDEGRVFASWADQLWNAGIRSIEGRLIGDDNAFDDDGVGAGWSWEDLALGYGAPVGALNYDDNAVELVVRPGAAAGAEAELTFRPSAGGLRLDNRAVTTPSGDPFGLTLRRAPGAASLMALGTVPLGMAELVRTVSVVNPTITFLTALRQSLVARGIGVDGAVVDLDDLDEIDDLDRHLRDRNGRDARVLLSHRSPPLSEVALVLMKASRNLHAETLLKTLGRGDGRVGTAETGREAFQDVLGGWGVPADSVIVSDGSGLSRYNYVTPDALAVVLRRMASDARFDAVLPVAGRDGTMADRLRGTPAENNVRAKDGALSNVRALSGYVRTRDGERLDFAIVANNFDVAPAEVNAAVDRAVERLAGFSRSAR